MAVRPRHLKVRPDFSKEGIPGNIDRLMMNVLKQLVDACQLALTDHEVEGIELNHDTVSALRKAVKDADALRHEIDET